MSKYTYLICALGALVMSTACDTIVQIENQSPTVDVLGLCIEDTNIYIDMVIFDLDEDPVDIALRVDAPDEIVGLITNVSTPSLIAAGPEADGLLGLTANAQGQHHRIQWARCNTEDSTCTLPSEILALGGLNGCACVTSFDLFHVLQSLEVRATDRSSEVTTRTFTDLEVLETCAAP